MRSWKEICRESIVQVSNNTFNLQNHSGTFKSYRKSVMKYDHWVKMEGNQENHHVLNDLPLKRALWGVKKGSNAKKILLKHCFSNMIPPDVEVALMIPAISLSCIKIVLRSNLLNFRFFENEPFSKQFRSKIASYHYAGIVDAQMFSYFFEMFKKK